MNEDRILKLLEDFREWENDFSQCVNAIKQCESEDMRKLLYHSARAYFLDFHILCEDYISINLKELRKFKIDISAIGGMEIIKESGVVSKEILEFYSSSRRLRNRLAHRYKVPDDGVLVKNLEQNMELIKELSGNLKKMLSY
ncbi:HepT-like ribonuclease domain-containing protein [uncultured Clostridium sp.]|uniref:HepT-like ribonuclease domain-containing protein n=1 Tax=uncultured Clostridium sp. TaxID=59620 RepID=UPI0026224ECD|nr:HepT-like ribonuclease domain-containing protein [uncultured Clostridium sp.]